MQAPAPEGSPGNHTEIADSQCLVMDPLVSVLMITYNHAPYIAQAIEGVLSQQTDFPLELIIGEDCSTDRTREIVLNLERQHPETIRVLFSEKNVGMHKNLRRVAAAARGEYVAFCEGDDWWHRPDKLQRQISALRPDPSLVCVAGGIRHVSATGDTLEAEGPADAVRPPFPVDYPSIIFSRILLYTCTAVCRTDAVRQVLDGDGLCRDQAPLMADHSLWIELSQLGHILYLPEALASYRHTPNSAVRQSDPLRVRRFEMSFHNINYRALERYPLPEGAARTSRAQADFARQILLKAAWNGEAEVAKKQLRRLRGLGEKVGARELGCAVLAWVPLPRRWLTTIFRKLTPRLARAGLNLRKHLAPAAVFSHRTDKP